MDYQKFIWKETSPGQYERDIDEAEQFYTSLAKAWEGAGHTFFAITSCIGVKIAQTEGTDIQYLNEKIDNAFKHAWKRLRYDHPTLTASVVYDSLTKKCKKVYKSPASDLDIENWTIETFRIIQNGQSGEDFANSDPPLGPKATLYLVKPPQDSAKEVRREIFFRSHHDIIDGIGTFYLLSNLLRHASFAFASNNPAFEWDFGSEIKNLSPPFRLAALLPPSPSPAQLDKLESIRTLNNSSRSETEVLALLFRSKNVMPKNSRRMALHFSTKETAAIIAQCKRHGATPTHTFHAAIALALRDVQVRTAEARPARYMTYSLLNLRTSCLVPYNSPQHAAAVYHCVSAKHLVVDTVISSATEETQKTQDPEEFLKALEQVKAYAQSIKVNTDYLSIVPNLFSAVTPPYPSTLPLVPDPNPTPAVSLSSLGVMDHIFQPRYQDFEIVSEPWVVGAEYSTGYGLFLGTWKGIMCLSAAYNEAFHEEGEVRVFLERVGRIACEGLGVERGASPVYDA